MELINASVKNNINKVKLLLERKDLNINLQNDNGWTALIIALEYDYIDIVKLLCNFDLRSKFTGQSG
jgi:ankyrin repeat protein